MSNWYQDAPELKWDRPETRAAHEILYSAFRDVDAAIDFAETAGINRGDIDLSGSAAIVWRRILDAAAASGRIERLLERVFETESVHGFHEQLRRTFSTPLGEAGVKPPDRPPSPQPGPEPDEPQEPARTAPRVAELADLLVALFTVDELRRFLLRLPEGRNVVDGLPANVSLAKLAGDAEEALRKRGLVDANLHERLLHERPRRSEEIDGWWRQEAVRVDPPPRPPQPQPRPRKDSDDPGQGGTAGANDKDDANLSWRFFAVGIVATLAAVGLAIWGFGQAEPLRVGQQTILAWALSVSSGFAAGCFAGGFTVKARSLASGAVATATGGFAVWGVTFFALLPPDDYDLLIQFRPVDGATAPIDGRAVVTADGEPRICEPDKNAACRVPGLPRARVAGNPLEVRMVDSAYRIVGGPYIFEEDGSVTLDVELIPTAADEPEAQLDASFVSGDIVIYAPQPERRNLVAKLRIQSKSTRAIPLGSFGLELLDASEQVLESLDYVTDSPIELAARSTDDIVLDTMMPYTAVVMASANGTLRIAVRYGAAEGRGRVLATVDIPMAKMRWLSEKPPLQASSKLAADADDAVREWGKANCEQGTRPKHSVTYGAPGGPAVVVHCEQNGKARGPTVSWYGADPERIRSEGRNDENGENIGWWNFYAPDGTFERAQCYRPGTIKPVKTVRDVARVVGEGC